MQRKPRSQRGSMRQNSILLRRVADDFRETPSPPDNVVDVTPIKLGGNSHE